MGFKEEFLQFHLSGLMVEELKEETYNHEACLSKAGVRKSSSYPENYETCMNVFGVLGSLFQVLSGCQILYISFFTNNVHIKFNLVSPFHSR